MPNPATPYILTLLHLLRLINQCLRELRRIRPAFLALLTSFDANCQVSTQLGPLLNYVEVRFAVGYNFREYWAWRLAPIVFFVHALWWAGIMMGMMRVWHVAVRLWIAVGWWVMGNE